MRTFDCHVVFVGPPVDITAEFKVGSLGGIKEADMVNATYLSQTF